MTNWKEANSLPSISCRSFILGKSPTLSTRSAEGTAWWWPPPYTPWGRVFRCPYGSQQSRWQAPKVLSSMNLKKGNGLNSNPIPTFQNNIFNGCARHKSETWKRLLKPTSTRFTHICSRQAHKLKWYVTQKYDSYTVDFLKRPAAVL